VTGHGLLFNGLIGFLSPSRFSTYQTQQYAQTRRLNALLANQTDRAEVEIQTIWAFHSSSRRPADFVVALLLIVDLVARPHAVGGFVICLANTR